MPLALTLFTTCKPFTGKIAVAQQNALCSWKRLCPPSEVIVFGDEIGVDEWCRKLGFRQVPEIVRNELGTPLISAMFERAENLAHSELLCYVNADIMLTMDVLPAARLVSENFDKFLLIARRWNADVDYEWDDRIADWDGALRRYAITYGNLEPPSGGTDLFIYRRGTLFNLPPLAVGRSNCDSMLIHEGLRMGIPVIDATEVLTLLHQNHDYSHITDTSIERPKGPESLNNEKLLGGDGGTFTSLNATHHLGTSGIQRSIDFNPA